VTENEKENCFVGNVALPLFSCNLSFTNAKMTPRFLAFGDIR
jgi:hypothetical protein